jgi:hypothetical protein
MVKPLLSPSLHSTCTLHIHPHPPASWATVTSTLQPLLLVSSSYLLVCLLSTIYDLVNRYQRDLLRLKLSKVQRQMHYEEQQRKLMKNLMSEAYYDDLMHPRSIDTEEDGGT